MTPSTEALLEAGREYQAHGWAMFALRGKVPTANCGSRACWDHLTPDDMAACDCLTCHGCYAASTDPAKLQAQLSAIENKGDGIVTLGLATGLVSGVVVLDLDVSENRTRRMLQGTAQDFIKTDSAPQVWARTRRGLHYYFDGNGLEVPCSASKVGAGLDIRGDGGYVVAPPSPDREWLPGMAGWRTLPRLPKLLWEAATHVRTDDDLVHGSRKDKRRGSLAGLCAFVASGGEGERNSILHWAARRAAELVADAEVTADHAVEQLVEAAASCGLSDREAFRTVTAAMRRGGAGWTS